MKIAVVIPKYGLVGGAENFVFELTERLSNYRDFQIHVFAHQWQKKDSSITFHKIPYTSFPRFFGPIGFAHFVKKIIQKDHFDLIHSHDRIFEMDLLTFHGIPHKTWIKEGRKKRLSLFDKATAMVEQKGIDCNKFPIILPVSNLVKEELLRCYQIPESRIKIIHPGVSSKKYLSINKESCRNEIRHKLGLDLNDIVIVFVGMDFERKRLDLVMKGVAELKKNINFSTQIKLLVVGKGNINFYRNLSTDLGIADNIIFTGTVYDVEKYYFASDIFALPSIYDPFGMVVLEAMLAGLPVIITEKVGAKDLIKPGLHGYILPENPSPFDMKNAISSLLDHNKRITMGENCKKIALLHDWDNVASQVADLYQKLLIKGVTP